VPYDHRQFNRNGQHRAPTILLIVADDLGYADLSITGRDDYRTPVIDQIARGGALLTHSYSSAPICTPTRVAFMTGRYPARRRLRWRAAERKFSPVGCS
jgi:arylsulfatase A-like enzyme